MLANIWIVLRKELVDHFRDQRSLTTSLFSALLGPLMLLMLLFVIGRTASDATEGTLDLPISGAENAPGLMVFLEQQNINPVPAPADPEAAVRSGEAPVVLSIAENYQEQIDAGLPAPIAVIADTSRQSAGPTLQRALTVLEAYNNQLARLRLQARGVSPSVIDPIVVELVDTATPQSRAAALLNILPYFLIFAVFVGGMGMTIDITAGERERGSLEPLLITPLSRADLALGKLAATLTPAAISVLAALLGFAAVINFAPLDQELGVRLSLDTLAFLGIFMITLPMLLLAGALQMIIASGSRSVKEAQSYLGFLPLIPALPGLFLAFLPIQPALWMMLVPTFGQQLLINQLMRGEAIDPLFVAVSTLTTILAAVILTLYAIRLFARERMVM